MTIDLLSQTIQSWWLWHRSFIYPWCPCPPKAPPTFRMWRPRENLGTSCFCFFCVKTEWVLLLFPSENSDDVCVFLHSPPPPHPAGMKMWHHHFTGSVILFLPIKRTTVERERWEIQAAEALGYTRGRRCVVPTSFCLFFSFSFLLLFFF